MAASMCSARALRVMEACSVRQDAEWGLRTPSGLRKTAKRRHSSVHHCNVELQAKHACSIFACSAQQVAHGLEAQELAQTAQGSRLSALCVPSQKQERSFVRPAGVLCLASTGAAGATTWSRVA